MTGVIEVHDSVEALARAGAEWLVQLARDAVDRQGRFTIALSGGSTPRRLHETLADDEVMRARMPWPAVQVFWGDERHVPPTHPDSNYRMARETLLDRVPVPADHVYRIPAEVPDAEQAAIAYEHTLCAAFALSVDLHYPSSHPVSAVRCAPGFRGPHRLAIPVNSPSSHPGSAVRCAPDFRGPHRLAIPINPPTIRGNCMEVPSEADATIAGSRDPEPDGAARRELAPPAAYPTFDAILLGMGPDGHTASIFPGSAVVHERDRLVVAPWVEHLAAHRVTVTPPVLTNAASILVLVAGAEKADVLRAVLDGPFDPERLPIQILREAGTRVRWLVDRAAASKL